MVSVTDEITRRPLQEILKSDPKLNEIKEKLVIEFGPSKLYLFGSRVYGHVREDSDYDFLLVVDKTTQSRFENMERASKILKDLHISADVFVYSQKEFDEWKNELNCIAEAAYNLGVELPLG